MFTLDNTDGYSLEALEALNQEFRQRIEDLPCRLEDDELEELAKAFADEVSRR